MLEITLAEPDDFLKVRETLTRIGVASRKENKLFQSCHILHKQGRYFIVHFKELFMLDGKKSNLEQSDIERRNTIATLLSDWGLVEIQNTEQAKECSSLKQIKIIPYLEIFFVIKSWIPGRINFLRLSKVYQDLQTYFVSGQMVLII